MKKLILTIAIILGMGTMSFAQFGEDIYEESGLFGKGPGLFRSEDPLLPNHNEDEDVDADQVPLGSGIAMLVSLGAAYAIAKKRREE